MLQRLEFADQLAELLALLEILRGAAERFVGDPEHFACDHRATGIEHAVEHGATLIDLAEHAVGGQLDVGEIRCAPSCGHRP